MIRKVYRDLIWNKIAKKEFSWILRRGMQYALTHASYWAGRPLCGPILGTVVTNYRCNYRCTMCDLPLRDAELQSRGLCELDTKQMKQVLDSFARLGTPGIGFTGGEPLLRQDIFELLAYTRDLGMISHLNTNGSLLDAKNISRIMDSRVSSLCISLDGARAETHDHIRGVRGSFENAIDAIGRLDAARRRRGSPLRIKTVAVLQEKNIDEVQDLVRLAGGLGVDCIEFIPLQPFIASRETASNDPKFLEKVDQVTDYLLKLKQGPVQIENSATHIKLFRQSFLNAPSPLRCYAGYNSYTVDCYGEIYPCVPWYNWRRSVGNIKDQDLASFWYSTDYNKVRAEIGQCRKCYLNCQTELNIMFNLVSST